MTPSERLRLLADWCELNQITNDEVVRLGVDSWEADAHLDYPALVRLWPGRAWEPDKDGHVVFHEGAVRIACVLSFDERVQLLEASR